MSETEFERSDSGSGRLVPGIVTLLLFGVLSVTFLTTEFDDPAVDPFAGESVIHNIGYALFHLEELATIPSEGFLAAFLIIALALDVAVDGALYLAKREEEGSVVSAVGGAFTDGGQVDRGGNR